MTVGGVMKTSMAIAFMAMVSAHGATFTVSKDGRGAFTTIQAAVNTAGKGDIVEILDDAVYPEQVTIDSNKHGLTLRSSNPTALKKPTIKWEDLQNQGPKSCPDALIPEKITFDQNGALRLLRVRNILIDGIGVDGVQAKAFTSPAVWGNGIDCTTGQRFALFHGNGGIALFIAGNVTIRNSDISNAFFGITVKDRNEGGVFANVNPADLAKSNVIPLSGFGKTGNHVFEKNRVHNNSWGFYFESSWDLGSTARYNLIYKNHHVNPAAVRALGEDGTNSPGGAFLFKDVMLSPMAIYNNTFWHNFTLFAGGYRPGAQHLVFNNIYAQPNEYWGKNAYGDHFTVLDRFMINRMKHCLYAAQTQAPETRTQNVQEQMQDPVTNQPVRVDSNVVFYQSTRIMNGMGNVAQENFTVDLTLVPSTGPPVVRPVTIQGANLPGGLIQGATAAEAFPAAANIRWYEIQFKSTDPASPDFLAPDWENEVVKKYVMNAGWPEAGIFNADGKVADLGAIPSTLRHTDDVVIRPLSPVIINGTTATLNFDLSALTAGSNLTAPKIKYIKLVRALPVDTTGYGGKPILIVPQPVNVTPSTTALQMGANTITATFQSPFPATEKYAFFEIIAEGTGKNGLPATTSVGFLPYRTLDKKFKVEVLDATGKVTDSVRVGESVKLRISPLNLDGTTFAGPISQTEVFLGSGSDLFTTDNPPAKFVLSTITGVTTKDVLFTKIPRGGLEYVNATGIARSPSVYVFFGSSNPIKILPAAPEKVIFQDPPSKILTPGAAPVIDPGMVYTVKVEVRDRFDNVITSPVSVTIKSNHLAIGNIDGPATALTDSLGIATFKAKVTNGNEGQLFELEASIPGKPADKADLKVGKARDRLYILYSDLTAYNPATELPGTAGDRLPVTIRAGKDPNTVIPDRLTEFTVSTTTPGLEFYASATSAAPASTFTLVAGEAIVYVKGTLKVENGNMTVTPTADNTILGGVREKIYFSFTAIGVLSASAHADNGYASVDRIEIRFRQDLKRAPDSIRIEWPVAGANPRTLATGITLDPADPRHVTLRLSAPFPAGLSAGTGTGTVYTYDPATPGIAVQAASYTAVDSVGPLLDSARVRERTGPGEDTLYVAFNEKVVPGGMHGASLVLIKKAGGAPIVLVVASQEIPSPNGAGREFRVSLADLGPNAPQEGDSLRIQWNGPITDAVGNRAHAANRPVALGLKFVPRPPFLTLRMDKPLQSVENSVQTMDFLVLSPNPDSSWTPVQGGLTHGRAAPCGALPCGNPVRGDATGALDRPAFTVQTDRAMKYGVTVFNNLGEFLNGFTGEITNAQLGLDARNNPLPGAQSEFRRGAQGLYSIKISWNGKSHNGARAATGAYLAKVTAISQAEDANGKPFTLSEARVIRFGLMRK